MKKHLETIVFADYVQRFVHLVSINNWLKCAPLNLISCTTCMSQFCFKMIVPSEPIEVAIKTNTILEWRWRLRLLLPPIIFLSLVLISVRRNSISYHLWLKVRWRDLLEKLLGNHVISTQASSLLKIILINYFQLLQTLLTCLFLKSASLPPLLKKASATLDITTNSVTALIVLFRTWLLCLSA